MNKLNVVLITLLSLVFTSNVTAATTGKFVSMISTTKEVDGTTQTITAIFMQVKAIDQSLK